MTTATDEGAEVAVVAAPFSIRLNLKLILGQALPAGTVIHLPIVAHVAAGEHAPVISLEQGAFDEAIA